mmetsp:Transcript_98469/g.301248  ORF Transcript_98469/g.301248 Transcript_98469/m.301248 type:complete len:83 (+) Transcript_98469:190-438(+)
MCLAMWKLLMSMGADVPVASAAKQSPIKGANLKARPLQPANTTMLGFEIEGGLPWFGAMRAEEVCACGNLSMMKYCSSFVIV